MPKKLNNENLIYNYELEQVFIDLFGRKGSYGIAGAFQDASFTKRHLKKLIHKLHGRLLEISDMDLYLKEDVNIELEYLIENIKKIGIEKGIEWKIIARILNIFLSFLGFCDGKIVRNVVVFQDKIQQEIMSKNRGKIKYQEDIYKFDEKDEKKKLIKNLLKDGYSKYQVSRLLNIPLNQINN